MLIILTIALFIVSTIGIYLMGYQKYTLWKAITTASGGWIGFIAFGAWATSGEFQWGLVGLSILILLLIIGGIWVGITVEPRILIDRIRRRIG